MNVLKSDLNARSESFTSNTEHMQSLVDDLKAQVDQNEKGTVIGDFRIRIPIDLDSSVGVLYLDYWSLSDKQPGQRNRFCQRAAPISAKVNNQPVDILLLQLGEQLSHITGGAPVIGVIRVTTVKITIEGRKVDHAYP